MMFRKHLNFVSQEDSLILFDILHNDQYIPFFYYLIYLRFW